MLSLVQGLVVWGVFTRGFRPWMEELQGSGQDGMWWLFLERRIVLSWGGEDLRERGLEGSLLFRRCFLVRGTGAFDYARHLLE